MSEAGPERSGAFVAVGFLCERVERRNWDSDGAAQ